VPNFRFFHARRAYSSPAIFFHNEKSESGLLKSKLPGRPGSRILQMEHGSNSGNFRCDLQNRIANSMSGQAISLPKSAPIARHTGALQGKPGTINSNFPDASNFSRSKNPDCNTPTRCGAGSRPHPACRHERIFKRTRLRLLHTFSRSWSSFDSRSGFFWLLDRVASNGFGLFLLSCLEELDQIFRKPSFLGGLTSCLRQRFG